MLKNIFVGVLITLIAGAVITSASSYTELKVLKTTHEKDFSFIINLLKRIEKTLDTKVQCND